MKESIYRALQAGAATYLLKNTLSDDLVVVRVLREMHGDEHPCRRSRRAARARQGEPTLTQREIEVVRLPAQGMRNKEIGANLGITEETAHR